MFIRDPNTSSLSHSQFFARQHFRLGFELVGIIVEIDYKEGIREHLSLVGIIVGMDYKKGIREHLSLVGIIVGMDYKEGIFF